MSFQRISVKLFVNEPNNVVLAEYVPIFQRWIQQSRLAGLLIDVVDYKHVVDGPGVILIGSESDYALDMQQGRPGLLYTRKRQLQPEFAAALTDALRLALTAAQLLEGDRKLKGRITFDPTQALISLHDRLRAPNSVETFEAVRPALTSVLGQLYGVDAFTLAAAFDDPRHLFAVQVNAPDAGNLAAIAERLQAVTA